MIAADELAPLVERWLPTQRWFAGKGRDAIDRRRTARGHSRRRAVRRAVDGASRPTTTAPTETYQLPLVAHTRAGRHARPRAARLDQDRGRRRRCGSTTRCTTRTSPGLARRRPRRERRQARCTSSATSSQNDIPRDVTSLVLTGEQSNTSLMYGDPAIMKVFRRLQPGRQPRHRDPRRARRARRTARRPAARLGRGRASTASTTRWRCCRSS